jgi:hypothetical protein
VNADPDTNLTLKMNADPDPGKVLKKEIFQRQIKCTGKIFMKIKSNLTIFIPITLLFILFMPNSLSFGRVFSFILA